MVYETVSELTGNEKDPKKYPLRALCNLVDDPLFLNFESGDGSLPLFSQFRTCVRPDIFSREFVNVYLVWENCAETLLKDIPGTARHTNLDARRLRKPL